MITLEDAGTIALDIVETVCGCLETTTNGSPSTCGVYWSTPPDDLDCGDCGTNGALLAWLTAMGLTDNFPNGVASNIRKTPALTVYASLSLRLIRPCWPMVGSNDNDAQPIPTRDTTEGPSLALMEDAAAVMCCLTSQAMSQSGIFGQCERVWLGEIQPDPNRGGCAGFTVPMTVDLGRCCRPT